MMFLNKTKDSKMDKICAVIDIQGFQLSEKFVPREVAMVSENFSQCFEINPELNFRDLNEKDRQTVIHTTKFLNGLHILPFNDRNFCYLPKESDVGEILKFLYNVVASDDKPFVAVKNKPTLQYLIDLDIPFLDLNDPIYSFPNFNDIRNKYGNNYICAYHKRPPPNSNIILTCAYRKCAQIYREINEKLLFKNVE